MIRFAVSVIILSFFFAACGSDGKKKYSLTVEAVDGTAILSPAGGRYTEGTPVSVRVYPRTGFAFSAWEGDVVSADEVLALTMDSNISLTGRCVASPASFVWPDSTNSGVPAGTDLTVYDGDNRTTEDGQVFENYIFDARIYVNHANVIFRNCHLRGDKDPYHVVHASAAGTGLTIERCDINRGIVIADGFTGRGNHIYAASGKYLNDGFCFNASNVLLENNLIDGLRGNQGAHLDGIQIMGGSDIVIRNNRIEATTSTPIEGGGVNAAIFFAPDLAPIRNAVVDHNMLIQLEGYYPLRIYDTGGTVVVQNNLWNAAETVPLLHIENTVIALWEGNATVGGEEIPDPSAP